MTTTKDPRLAWLDNAPARREGSVVHTLLDGKPVKCVRVGGEWVAEREEWAHDRS